MLCTAEEECLSAPDEVRVQVSLYPLLLAGSRIRMWRKDPGDGAVPPALYLHDVQ